MGKHFNVVLWLLMCINSCSFIERPQFGEKKFNCDRTDELMRPSSKWVAVVLKPTFPN